MTLAVCSLIRRLCFHICCIFCFDDTQKRTNTLSCKQPYDWRTKFQAFGIGLYINMDVPTRLSKPQCVYNRVLVLQSIYIALWFNHIPKIKNNKPRCERYNFIKKRIKGEHSLLKNGTGSKDNEHTFTFLVVHVVLLAFWTFTCVHHIQIRAG